jgi:hypothetical protein
MEVEKVKNLVKIKLLGEKQLKKEKLTNKKNLMRLQLIRLKV